MSESLRCRHADTWYQAHLADLAEIDRLNAAMESVVDELEKIRTCTSRADSGGCEDCQDAANRALEKSNPDWLAMNQETFAAAKALVNDAVESATTDRLPAFVDAPAGRCPHDGFACAATTDGIATGLSRALVALEDRRARCRHVGPRCDACVETWACICTVRQLLEAAVDAVKASR